MTRRVLSRYLQYSIIHALQMQITFVLCICLQKAISLLERRVRLGMIRHAAFPNSEMVERKESGDSSISHHDFNGLRPKVVVELLQE